MRAAIYARISDARDDNTAGVRRQEQDCRALALERGWEVVDVYVDNNRSATSGTRPEYRRLLDDVRSGEIDCVIVWATDRLYRRLTDLEELVTVLGATPVATVKSGDVDLSTADGKTIARILGSVAQGEVEKRGERVARAARQRAEAGRFGGGTRRFGYTADMKALVPEEADAIARAYEQVLAGHSLRSIAREWAERGLRGPTGASIAPHSVRFVLLRPVNAGLSVYRGEVVGKSVAPTIIDEKTFRRTVALLTDPKRRETPGDGRRTLLAGVLVCGVCGGPMMAHNRSWRDGRHVTRRLGYGCNRSRCVTRSRQRMDEAVSRLVIDFLVLHRDTYRRAPATASAAAHRSAQEAESIRHDLKELADLMASRQLSPADYAAAAGGLRERLAAAEARVARQAGFPTTARLLQSKDVGAAWQAAADATKRAVLREVVESITVPVGTPGKFSMKGVKVTWRVRGAM